MKKLFKLLILALFILPITYYLLPMTCTYAAVPHLINYQGRLTDTNGAPLNGSYSLTFRIYDAETAGNMLWEETQSGVVVQKGIFNILLGSVTNLGLAFDKPYWLEIKVGSEVMSPRQRITSAGYAIKAEQANNATTLNNVSVSTTPEPNKILPLDNNAKLPVSALKIYDSGWFPVSVRNVYTKNHGLGTTRLLVTVYFATDINGTNMSQIIQCVRIDSGSSMYGAQIQNITNTTLDVHTGYHSLVVLLNATGSYDAVYSSGYYRVVALALE